MDLRQVFYRLVKVGAPSGFEEPMIVKLKEELAPYVDEVYDTPRGNVVAVQHGTDPKAPKVALAAHMDQVGFVVHNIDEKGFIRFRRIGGAVGKAVPAHPLHHREGPRLRGGRSETRPRYSTPGGPDSVRGGGHVH
jgi:putative aminopeptidase FrvX